MGKILLAALIVRLIGLNQSLWLDEAISYLAVKSFSFWEIITKFSPGDVHPPLYYLLLKLWTNLFGYSEISLRLPSVIAGVVAVFVVIKIGQKLFNKRVGLLAGLFLALNPLAVYYSQEARMYSLAMLVISLAAWAFICQKKWLVVSALVAAFYIDYIPWLIVPVFFPASLLAFIFVAPWLPVVWQQFQASLALARQVPLWGQVVGGFSLKALTLAPVKFIFGRIPTQPFFALLVILYFWIIARVRNRFLWTWLLTPVVLGFILSLKVPIFTYHRFLFVLPAFVLLLAAGAAKRRFFVGLVLAVSLLSLAFFNFNSNLQREDWRAATIYINSDPGKVVMPSFAQDAALRYYGATMAEKDTPVYLVRYVQEIFDPQDSKRILLENSGYKKIEEKNFNGVVIWKYVF